MRKHKSHLWPILACSAAGVAGIAVATTKLTKKHERSPAETAAYRAMDTIKDARSKIEEIVGEVRSSLPEQGSAALQELNKIIADAKCRLDDAIEQMKARARKMAS